MIFIITKHRNLIGREKSKLKLIDKNKRNKKCYKCMKNGNKSTPNSINLNLKIPYKNKKLFLNKIKDINIRMMSCNRNIMLKILAEIPIIMSGLIEKPNNFQLLPCKLKAINFHQDLLSKFKDIPRAFQ